MLTITHPCSDVDTAGTAGAAREFNDRATQRVTLRSQEQVGRFFDGLDLADPGIVQVQDWRPDSGAEPAMRTAVWAGVARKP